MSDKIRGEGREGKYARKLRHAGRLMIVSSWSAPCWIPCLPCPALLFPALPSPAPSCFILPRPALPCSARPWRPAPDAVYATLHTNRAATSLHGNFNAVVGCRFEAGQVSSENGLGLHFHFIVHRGPISAEHAEQGCVSSACPALHVPSHSMPAGLIN